MSERDYTSYKAKFPNLTFDADGKPVYPGDDRSYKAKFPQYTFDASGIPYVTNLNTNFSETSYKQKRIPDDSYEYFDALGISVPTYTTDSVTGVITCDGTTSDGANFLIQYPPNFNGNLFLWSHPYRVPFDIPDGAGGYLYQVSYNAETCLTPEASAELLSRGFALMGSGFVTEGWNSNSALDTNRELIYIFKREFGNYVDLICWGASQGGFISQCFDEKYPSLLSATGLISPAFNKVNTNIALASQVLWMFKWLFNPLIIGSGYAAAGAFSGVPAISLVYYDLGLLESTLTALYTAILTGTWPTTSPAELQSSGIPPSAVVLLIGLITGLPYRSASYDATTDITFGGAFPVGYFSTYLSAALGVFENISRAGILAISLTYDLETQCDGGVVVDNTGIEYNSTLLTDALRTQFNTALGGVNADTVISTILGYLNGCTRITADPVALAKLNTFVNIKGTVNEVPTAILTGTCDPITNDMFTQWYIDKYDIYKSPSKRMLATTWAVPPDTYSVWEPTALNPFNLKEVAPEGTNHFNYSTETVVNFALALVEMAKKRKIDTRVANLLKATKVNDTDFTSIENPDFRVIPVPLDAIDYELS